MSMRGVSIAVLLAISSIAFDPAPASADPQPKIGCAELDQLTESLDDDLTAGIDGVRGVISAPYGAGWLQQRDTNTKLEMVSHGVHYMQDINNQQPVPGLAPLLDSMDRANNDMSDAVRPLFQWVPDYSTPMIMSPLGSMGSTGSMMPLMPLGSYGGSRVSTAAPTPATWVTIDYADQKKNDLYGLVNGLRGQCAP